MTLSRYGDLSGISVDAAVSCRVELGENLLFTHRGLSGPAIPQISSTGTARSLSIDLLPEIDVAEWLVGERASPARLDTSSRALPKRLAQQWCAAHQAVAPIHQLGADRLAAESALHGWRVQPGGTLGYNKAEVTLGGVDTRELSSKTMVATRVPGLFFIGEVVDVTGHLGGYNFQWAWASGHAAGQFV
jgi:predicted Rossmann fold flavoprotein